MSLSSQIKCNFVICVLNTTKLLDVLAWYWQVSTGSWWSQITSFFVFTCSVCVTYESVSCQRRHELVPRSAIKSLATMVVRNCYVGKPQKLLRSVTYLEPQSGERRSWEQQHRVLCFPSPAPPPYTDYVACTWPWQFGLFSNPMWLQAHTTKNRKNVSCGVVFVVRAASWRA